MEAVGSTEALQQQHAALLAAEQTNLGQMKRSVSFWLGPGASAEVEAIAEVLEDEEGGCSALLTGPTEDGQLRDDRGLSQQQSGELQGSRAEQAAAGHGAVVAKMHSDCAPMDQIIPGLYLGLPGLVSLNE